MSQNLEKFGVEAVWQDAKFEKGVKGYNDSLKRADRETQKFTRAGSKSFQQFDKQASASLTDIRSGIQLTIGALRTFAQAAGAAFRAAQEGAQQLGQMRSFAIVSGGADQAAKNLQAMREATRGTATDAALMEQALGILATGLATNEDELFKVTRNVTTLARVLKGFGAERALLSFQLLATDIEASRARLDDFGLTFAEVKPKIDALVDSGMNLQEATRTVLLEEMDVKMAALGLTAATTADSFGQLTAVSGNLSNQFKQALAPAGAIVADALTRALSDADDLTEAFDRIARGAIKAASAFDAFFSVMTEFDIDNVRELGTVIGLQLRGDLDATGRFWQIYDEGVERGAQAMNEAKDVAADLGKEIGGVGDEMGGVADETEAAADALAQFSDTIAASRTQALEAFLQRAIAVERQLEDAAIARARKIEDIERQAAARRAQIQEQYAQTVANLQDQFAEQQRQNAINLARQLEQIERNYQERRRAIQQQFAVSFARAVRSRDALALVEAIRTRDRDLEEARNQRDQERSEATSAAAQQEAEQQRSLERQIEAARVARAQQLADAEAAEAAQLEAMQRAEARQAEDRALAAARWLEDQERAFEDRRVRALAQYRQDESVYLQHLQRMLQLTNTYIPLIFAVGGGAIHPGGGGVQELAEGGAFIATGATSFVAGEAGPELVIAQPLSQIADVNPVGPQVAGQMRHQVAGEIQASMAGFEGRLTAEVQRAVLDAFREVLR